MLLFSFSLLPLFLILLFNYIKCISSVSLSNLTHTSVSHFFSLTSNIFLTPIDRLSRQTLEYLSGVCMRFFLPPYSFILTTFFLSHFLSYSFQKSLNIAGGLMLFKLISRALIFSLSLLSPLDSFLQVLTSFFFVCHIVMRVQHCHLSILINDLFRFACIISSI